MNNTTDNTTSTAMADLDRLIERVTRVAGQLDKLGAKADATDVLQLIALARRAAQPVAPVQAPSELEKALRELMSIVRIHSEDIGENFAWAEMQYAKEVLAAPSPQVAEVAELPPSWITNTLEARMFVDAWHRKHFPTDRTFSRYIMADPARLNPLAGDFAWQLAKALEAMEARAAVSAATKPTADLSDEQLSPGDIDHIGSVCGNFSRLDMRWTFTPEQFQAAAHAIERRVRSLLATKPSAAPAVPEGFVLMPKRLTAENGAKSLFMGEFKESVELTCHDYEEAGEVCDDCETCGGSGTVSQPVTVEWDTIKRIYELAVEKLAATPAPASAGQAAPVPLVDKLIALRDEAKAERQSEADTNRKHICEGMSLAFGAAAILAAQRDKGAGQAGQVAKLDEAAAYRFWRDCMLAEDSSFVEAIQEALPGWEPDMAPPSAAAWDAAMLTVMQNRAQPQPEAKGSK